MDRKTQQFDSAYRTLHSAFPTINAASLAEVIKQTMEAEGEEAAFVQGTRHAAFKVLRGNAPELDGRKIIDKIDELMKGH